MTTDAYRFVFDDAVPAGEVEAALVLAIIAVGALHGDAQTRLDVGHAFDARRRVVVVDATTAVGRDLNRVFIGLLAREFGAGGFRVERVWRKPEAEPATA